MNIEKIQKYLKITIFLSIFIILLYLIGKIFNPTGTFKEWFQAFTVKEYYQEEKNSLDVIYVGNSMVYTAISPLEIYAKTGITGYDLSTQGQPINASYYFIKEACRNQNPKVVFVEIGDIFSNLSSIPENDIRKAIDSLKLSTNKLEMINDKTFGLTNFDKLTCVFPILRYHTRWSMLNETDIRKLYIKDLYTYKGFLLNNRTEKYEVKNKKINNKVKEKKVQIEINEEVDKIINKIIDYCKKNDICLKFIKLPEPKFWDENKNEIVEKYAREKNIEYIDMNYNNKIDINWEEDTFDNGDHLNMSGAEKVSEFIGDYLKKNFELEDHRNEEKFASWDELLNEYFDNKQRK